MGLLIFTIVKTLHYSITNQNNYYGCQETGAQFIYQAGGNQCR